MNKANKAQKALILSVLWYGLKAFVLIYCILFFFFIFSELSVVFIKSLNYDIQFKEFIKPMLIILPVLLSSALPFVFLITLAFILRKLKNNNFLYFQSIFQVSLKKIFMVGFGISIIFSITIFSLQGDLSERINRYVENKIKGKITLKPLAMVMEPNSFIRIKNYVLYLSDFLEEGKFKKGFKGHAYIVKFQKVGFVGRANVNVNRNGDIILENIKGYGINSRGYLKNIVEKKKKILYKRKIKKEKIKQFISFFKPFISSPSIPLTHRTNKLNSPYLDRLILFKKIQNLLMSIAPIIFFLIFFLIQWLMRSYNFFFNSFIYFIIPFIWCIAFLLFPLFVEFSLYKKPSSFWFWMILISGILTFITLFAMPYIGLFSKRIKNLKSSILNYESTKKKIYSIHFYKISGHFFRLGKRKNLHDFFSKSKIIFPERLINLFTKARFNLYWGGPHSLDTILTFFR